MLDLILPLLAGFAAACLLPGMIGDSDDQVNNDEDDSSVADEPEAEESEIRDEFWLLGPEERGSFIGGEGNDTIQVETETGSPKVDIWDAFQEQDESSGFEVRGGLGDDVLLLSGGGYTAYGDAGSDRIELRDASNVAVYGGYEDTILGGTGSNVYVRVDANAVFQGGAGDDYIHSKSSASADLGDGNDTFFGLNGTSATKAEFNADLVFGGGGDDYIVGGLNEFHLWWAHANDQAFVSFDEDTLYGGAGNDTIVGSHGDLMIGGEGGDRFELVLNQGVVDGPSVISDFDREKDFLEIRFGDGDGVEYSPEFYSTFSYESFGQSVTENGDTLIVESQGRILVRLEGVDGIKVGVRGWDKDAGLPTLFDLQGTAVKESDCDVIIRGQSPIFE